MTAGPAEPARELVLDVLGVRVAVPATDRVRDVLHGLRAEPDAGRRGESGGGPNGVGVHRARAHGVETGSAETGGVDTNGGDTKGGDTGAVPVDENGVDTGGSLVSGHAGVVRADVPEHAGPEDVLGAALLAAIERAPHLLIHAAAVARGGKAILFPGVSGLGKSTMAAACVLAGLDYLSDEAVSVDLDTSRVRGLARPIMLTPWSAAALGIRGDGADAKLAVAAEHLGGSVVGAPVPVGHVVVMRRGAASSRLTRLGTGEVLAELLTAAFNHYRHGARAWEAATRLVGEAQGWRLDVADPASAASLVVDELTS